MIQELLYTSHKGEGLKRGSGGGFCTVVCTQGMAPNIVRHLEQLSGYKHPFDVHDTRAAKNPVLYRCQPTTIGGTKYVALSRISDVKGDYSGRSNKLAHHVLLTQDEITEAGPASVLKRSGIFVEQWDGQVKEVQPRKSSAIDSKSFAGPCAAWKAVTGDAGWAGAVAERLTHRGADGFVRIIFPLGMDCLALAEEVFSLLPESKRWQTGFSTYVSDSANPCALEFLLDGTREASVMRKDRRKFVVDLCKPLQAPEPSRYVQAARSGDTTAIHQKPKSRLPSNALGKTPTAEEVDIEVEHELVLAPPDVKDHKPQVGRRRKAALGLGPSKASFQPKKKSYLIPILITAALLMLLLVGGGIALFMGTDLFNAEPNVVMLDDAESDKSDAELSTTTRDLVESAKTLEEDSENEDLSDTNQDATAKANKVEKLANENRSLEEAMADPIKEKTQDGDEVKFVGKTSPVPIPETATTPVTQEAFDGETTVMEEDSLAVATPPTPSDAQPNFEPADPSNLKQKDWKYSDNTEPYVIGTYSPSPQLLQLELKQEIKSSIKPGIGLIPDGNRWVLAVEIDENLENVVEIKADEGKLLFSWLKKSGEANSFSENESELFFIRFLEFTLTLKDGSKHDVALSPEPVTTKSNFETRENKNKENAKHDVDRGELLEMVYKSFNTPKIKFELIEEDKGWETDSSNRRPNQSQPDLTSLAIERTFGVDLSFRMATGKTTDLHLPIKFALTYDLKKEMPPLLKRVARIQIPFLDEDSKKKYGEDFRDEREVTSKLTKLSDRGDRLRIDVNNDLLDQLDVIHASILKSGGAPVLCTFFIELSDGRTKELLTIRDGEHKTDWPEYAESKFKEQAEQALHDVKEIKAERDRQAGRAGGMQ